MANPIQGLIKIENPYNIEFENFESELKECVYPMWFKKRDKNRYDFLTTYIDESKLCEISKSKNTNFTMISYDTAMGWASKVNFESGNIIEGNSVFFGLDTEVELMENINYQEEFFYDEISKYIDINGYK